MQLSAFYYFCVCSSFQAAKRELERQRQLEWERQRRQELLTQRNREQESIVLLKARKKTLEFELEALVIAESVSSYYRADISFVCRPNFFIPLVFRMTRSPSSRVN